ncbi:H-type small acid-soluble spore protein [Virgibacillus sp. FSP13]
MESQRAQEIIDSIVMMNVNYHGIPVYIKQVHPDQEMATIFPLDEMHHDQQVDLAGLFE